MASPVTRASTSSRCRPPTGERSRDFYVETLGLRPDETGDGEFWVGETCFGIYEPTTFGMEFAPQKNAHLALHVDDVAAARAELEAKGVEFDGETFDTGVCHMAFFEDPDGNALMLHHRYAPRGVMQVEHVDFVSVLTQDLQRARRFYVETLGLEVETEGDSDMELRCGQVTLDVFDPSSIGQPFAPSPAGIALRVADVDAARAELEAKGVVFDGDTIVTGVCKQAFFKDPDGNALMLHRRFDV